MPVDFASLPPPIQPAQVTDTKMGGAETKSPSISDIDSKMTRVAVVIKNLSSELENLKFEKGMADLGVEVKKGSNAGELEGKIAAIESKLFIAQKLNTVLQGQKREALTESPPLSQADKLGPPPDMPPPPPPTLSLDAQVAQNRMRAFSAPPQLEIDPSAAHTDPPKAEMRPRASSEPIKSSMDALKNKHTIADIDLAHAQKEYAKVADPETGARKSGAEPSVFELRTRLLKEAEGVKMSLGPEPAGYTAPKPPPEEATAPTPTSKPQETGSTEKGAKAQEAKPSRLKRMFSGIRESLTPSKFSRK